MSYLNILVKPLPKYLKFYEDERNDRISQPHNEYQLYKIYIHLHTIQQIMN